MSWNYRVIREGETLRIGEVYYDDDGTIEAWTLADFEPTLGWEELSELKGTVEHLLEAFDKPVLVCDRKTMTELTHES